MAKIPGPRIGEALCNALGLDAINVHSLTINLAWDQAVTVDANLFVTDEQGDAIVTELRRFEFAAIERKEVPVD